MNVDSSINTSEEAVLGREVIMKRQKPESGVLEGRTDQTWECMEGETHRVIYPPRKKSKMMLGYMFQVTTRTD